MSNVKHIDFQRILDEAIQSKGEKCLPNVTPIEDPLEALRAISALHKMAETPYQFRIREFDPPLNGRQTHEMAWYPKIFLTTVGMGGTFDGSGVILANQGKVYRFFMCEHVWDESGARRERGWHPKRCTKCGVDASIDSGD